jgi:hypothetical protein
MVDSSLETEIQKFAHSIHGTITFSEAGRIKRDNLYDIKTENESIQLIWGNQPEMGRGIFVTTQSIFSFNLKEGSKAILKIYPRDFLSTIFSIFSSKRSKTGNHQLDKSYLFLTNDSMVLSSIEPFLKDFKLNNKFQSFVMETRSGDDGANLFVIQINDLVSNEKDLSLLFKFGKNVVEKL